MQNYSNKSPRFGSMEQGNEWKETLENTIAQTERDSFVSRVILENNEYDK